MMEVRAWIGLFLIAMVTPAQGQWVKFEACGLVPQDEWRGNGEYHSKTHIAPEFGPIWVWVPSIRLVMGITEKRKIDGPACTMIESANDRVLVIGSLQETMKKLKAASR